MLCVYPSVINLIFSVRVLQSDGGHAPHPTYTPLGSNTGESIEAALIHLHTSCIGTENYFTILPLHSEVTLSKCRKCERV